MRRIIRLVRNNKLWSTISGLLVVIGFSSVVPLMEVGRQTLQGATTIYCSAQPNEEECIP